MNNFNNDFNTEQQNNERRIDLKRAKKTFSKIGLTLCAVILLLYVSQIALTVVLMLLKKENFINSSTGMWIMSIVPMYFFAFPAGLLMLRSLPRSPLEKKEITFKTFFIYLCIAFFLMSVGNYIGVFLSMMLSQGTAENALDTYALDMNPLKILVMVILAPLFEEFIFRKQIIDRTKMYGEKTAVILSGLIFGLFHTNMFQFFYAFFLGILFAYIYIQTGRLRYTVMIHGIINFCGSVVAPYIISKIDMEAIDKLSIMDANSVPYNELMEIMMPNMPGLTMLFAYYAASLGLAIAGFILFILKKKNIRWKPAELQLPHFEIATTVYMNIGIVLFIAITAGLTVASVFLN
ncbi:MAG: CPBP family intramembrane metalloprotease [Clostridia bacterium]|nr:CPBP family intramembrane metalloprotease [Clostridia bacterium]